MITELQSGKKLKRLVRVYGVGLVVVELSENAICFRVEGSRVTVGMSWLSAVSLAGTKDSVPSKLFGKPVELLTAEAAKVEARRAKKATKVP